MKRTMVFVTGVALIAAVAASADASAGSPARLPHTQHLRLMIVGQGSDARAVPAMGNIAVAAGVRVEVTVTSYSREYHTFTVPGLDVSALIPPARGHAPRTTTFTFTPSKRGSFAWHCVFCTGGDHGVAHRMGGTVFAIIDPSALP
jgi:hypothetical protein